MSEDEILDLQPISKTRGRFVPEDQYEDMMELLEYAYQWRLFGDYNDRARKLSAIMRLKRGEPRTS